MDLLRLLPFLLAVIVPAPALSGAEKGSRLFAHYMPCYSSKPVSGEWGYHSTMNHFDPDTIRWDGRREAASHDYPLIGLYDTRDPDALECHVLQMKLAGKQVVRTGEMGNSLTGDMGNSYRGGICPGKLRPKWNKGNNLRSSPRPGNSPSRS